MSSDFVPVRFDEFEGQVQAWGRASKVQGANFNGHFQEHASAESAPQRDFLMETSDGQVHAWGLKATDRSGQR